MLCRFQELNAESSPELTTDRLVSIVIESLSSIEHHRYFQTERGFQAELYAEMRCRLQASSIFKQSFIIEQEYQKAFDAHKVTKRPDIIIHKPTLQGHSRLENNLAVFELKLKATPSKARKDFENLVKVMKALKYPLGFFINISSRKNHLSECPAVDKGEIVAIAFVKGEEPILTRKVGNEIVFDSNTYR